MADNPPYMFGYGTIPKVLEKIKAASTPPRFTQDFLATKLGFPGGTPKPMIPLLKRIGFLGSDGIPTDLYKQFRNPSQSKNAMAQGIRTAYDDLYSRNEYLHELSDEEFRGLVVSATGLENDSRLVDAICGTFKALKSFASFEDSGEDEPLPPQSSSALAPPMQTPPPFPPQQEQGIGMNLSYTINLNLPATTDINVFNAIFKSLRDNLLKR
jgi:hypothetical protein